MGIGVVEIGFVLIVLLVTLLAIKATKVMWLATIPAFFLIAALVSPADPVSTLLIGVPNCVLFAVAFKYFTGEHRQHSKPVD